MNEKKEEQQAEVKNRCKHHKIKMSNTLNSNHDRNLHEFSRFSVDKKKILPNPSIKHNAHIQKRVTKKFFFRSKQKYICFG